MSWLRFFLRKHTDRPTPALVLEPEGGDLLRHAKNAVREGDLSTLNSIDSIVTRTFCTGALERDSSCLTSLGEFLGKFLAWFDWGGQQRLAEAARLGDRWLTILQLNHVLIESPSLKSAEFDIRKDSPVRRLVTVLARKKLMQYDVVLGELAEKDEKVGRLLLERLERAGIVVMETIGETVHISLGIEGIRLHQSQMSFASDESRSFLDALKYYDAGDFRSTEGRLKHAIRSSQGNLFATHLLGIVYLDQNDMHNASKYLSRSTRGTLSALDPFIMIVLLHSMRRLDQVENHLFTLLMQRDETVEAIPDALKYYSAIKQWRGDQGKARRYAELYDECTSARKPLSNQS